MIFRVWRRKPDSYLTHRLSHLHDNCYVVLVSSPERLMGGIIRGLGVLWQALVDKPKAGRSSVARQAVRSLCATEVARQSGGRQDSQIPCPGHRLRPVVDAELAVDMLGMGFDRVQRDIESRSDFWVG